MVKCSVEGCSNTRKTDLWNNIKSQNLGWFFLRDGTAYCPEHVPDWVPAWREKQARLSESK